MYVCEQMSDNRTILYVEDDDAIRTALLILLKKRYPRARLITAVNGKEGLEMFRRNSPDLVITDIIMPVMDGVQMLKGMEAVRTDVPIIITSADDDAARIRDAVALDLRCYLCKPIDVHELFEAIDGWFRFALAG